MAAARPSASSFELRASGREGVVWPPSGAREAKAAGEERGPPVLHLWRCLPQALPPRTPTRDLQPWIPGLSSSKSDMFGLKGSFLDRTSPDSHGKRP